MLYLDIRWCLYLLYYPNWCCLFYFSFPFSFNFGRVSFILIPWISIYFSLYTTAMPKAKTPDEPNDEFVTDMIYWASAAMLGLRSRDLSGIRSEVRTGAKTKQTSVEYSSRRNISSKQLIKCLSACLRLFPFPMKSGSSRSAYESASVDLRLLMAVGFP